MINLRTVVFNGPRVTLPGSCLGEVLSGGTYLGSVGAPYSGVICNVPNQAIPAAAVGSFWCAQVNVRDMSGNVVLSSAIYGIVDVQF